MIFTSYAFLFSFFPVVCGVYWLLNLCKPTMVLSKAWLICASLYFFSKGSLWFLPYFIGTIVFNYAIAIWLMKSGGQHNLTRKLILALGLVENIGLLGYYKYMNFFIHSANRLLSLEIPALNIVLPLGISFFTFQMIAYLVDCYRGKITQSRFMHYLMFVTFFPKMIIGPILQFQDFDAQLSSAQANVFQFDNIKKGFFVFSIGCAKKVLLATPMLALTTDVFADTASACPLLLWLGVFANLFSLYFDFSGYTDMAIGLGYFFNIKLPENFDSPYKARNIQQYWKKWHITLTGFLNQHVFNNMYTPAKGIWCFCGATMVTFLISGFWHGAGLTYILWGIIHGFALCFVAIVAVYYPKKYLLPKRVAHGVTLGFLLLTASLYSCSNVSSFFALLRGLVHVQTYTLMGKAEAFSQIRLFFCDNIYVIVILLFSMWVAFYAKTTKALTQKCITDTRYTFISTVLLVVSMFNMGATSTFVYMGF